jgi:Uma2 family endonuclease
MTTETETMPMTGLTLDEMPWKDPEVWPPTDLPYDDGDKMESPWHFGNSALLIANYVAARGGTRDEYYVGANMFVYFSSRQARNQDFKGPDFFIVKDVEGTRQRFSWVVWEEDGRYPDVIVELTSPSTEKIDLEDKKTLYAHTFRTSEYFCVAPNVEWIQGWRLNLREYEEIPPDERGWLWSEELGLWLGPWQGRFFGLDHTWLRFYREDGTLVLLPEEAERQRADTEQQRADTEQQRADTEQQRADTAEEDLKAERERTAALLDEIAQLKASLAQRDETS